ncbi:putative DNA-directed RNA polymerase, beta subunit [Salmonella phage vB_SalM_SA002]|nr:putative DNA-directed RNA polymerase, beta subunit [Salmonella phage vB_SalM_SA002]
MQPIATGGVCATVADHDKAFLQLPYRPVLINDFDLSIEAERAKLNAQMRVSYDADMFSVKPRCFCGKLEGGEKVGRVCGSCGHPVTVVTEEAIESHLWFQTPLGVAGYINPQMWTLLFEPFTVKGFNPLEYFADRQYSPAKGSGDYKNKEIYQLCKSMGFQRGINSLIENFDSIMGTLLNSPVVRSSNISSENLRNYAALYQQYRDVIFCQYLQLPSKLVFIVESNATGRYAEPGMKLAQDAALTVCDARKQIVDKYDLKFNENIAIKVVRQLADFYKAHDKDIFAGKPGLIRKNIGGSRMPFTARCVITSKTGYHDMDEVDIPRCIAIPLLRFHIANKLKARGYRPLDILNMMTSAVKRPDPVIESVLDELELEETAPGVLSRLMKIFLLRNPTLRWLSNRRFWARINRNPDEITIKISTLSINPSNADYDGDELNLLFVTDEVMSTFAEAFGSHNCVLDMNNPITVSGDIGLPATLISTINRWAYSHD